MAAGQIGQQPSAGNVQLTFPVVTQSQFTDPRQYERIILRANADGSRVLLKDIARVAFGANNYGFDFNPTVDRIRVAGSNGQNLRLKDRKSVV